jgi:ASPIC and UnbV/FG-GAP-like repeat/Secretion system C-terminal sorting domain
LCGAAGYPGRPVFFLPMRPAYLLIGCLLASTTSAQSIRFRDASSEAGIHTAGGSHGVAVADYDGDGWEDIYLAASGGHSTLFRNLGGTRFEAVTNVARVEVPGDAVNPLWGDLDNDGDPDLFVGVRSYTGATSRLFANNGDGTFTDITGDSGIDSLAIVGSATLGDYDNDGRLDVFLATRESIDRLYRNISDASIRFEDRTGSSNMAGINFSRAMQATWTDFDRDGRLDLLAVHDGDLASRLYRQTGGFPPFTEVTSSAGLAVSRSSMGVAWGDIDNDGWPDAYITNIDQGNLFRNGGDGTFEDVTESTGTGLNGMSWGVVFADFDNDGDQDLFIANTTSFDGRASFLYENREGVFVDVASAAGAAMSTDTFGVAAGDFNNDGRPDLFLADEAGENRLLLNASESAGNWLAIDLEGASTNHMAIGARIRAVAGGVEHHRTVDGGSSYCSQSSATLHVGLGSAGRVDSLQVFWTDGSVQVFSDLPANARYSLAQGGVVNVNAEREPVATFALSLYPNPVSDQATLTFTLEKPAPVTVELVDILGRRLRAWAPGTLSAGSHRIAIDCAGFPAGLYLIRWRAGDAVDVRTLMVR